MNNERTFDCVIAFLCIAFLSIGLLCSNISHRKDTINALDRVAALEQQVNELTDYNETLEEKLNNAQKENETLVERIATLELNQPITRDDVYDMIESTIIIKESELEKNSEPVQAETPSVEGVARIDATPEEIAETESHMTYVGHYELTAYEWTGNPCANGNYPTAGYTVACNSLPLGTRIYIDGYGYYTVEDTGGMSDNVVDIYMGDYDTCIQFGRQGGDVYIVD